MTKVKLNWSHHKCTVNIQYIAQPFSLLHIYMCTNYYYVAYIFLHSWKIKRSAWSSASTWRLLYVNYWNRLESKYSFKIHSDPWIYNQYIKLTLKFSEYIWVTVRDDQDYQWYVTHLMFNLGLNCTDINIISIGLYICTGIHQGRFQNCVWN